MGDVCKDGCTRRNNAYTFIRAGLSIVDFSLRLGSRVDVWVNVLKMPLAVQAMLVSACKSFDFLLGFLVAKASDSTSTAWGRRKPYIAIAFPLGALFYFFFVNAAMFIGKPTEQNATMPCVDLLGLNTSMGDLGSGETISGAALSCPELKACLDTAIADGLIDHPNRTLASISSAGTAFGAGHAFYFALFYLGFILSTWTVGQIPYDALGFELETDHFKRTALFGLKTIWMFVGYLLWPVLSLGLGTAAGLESDVVLMYFVFTVIVISIFAVGYAWLMFSVTERITKAEVPAGDGFGAYPDKPAGEKLASTPIIPTGRRLLANRPYVLYLIMKIPLSLFSLIPSNMASYFVRNAMQREAYTLDYSIALGLALVGGLLGSPVIVTFAKKYGKAKMQGYLLLAWGVIYIVFCIIPTSVYQASSIIIYIVGFFLGVGQTLAFLLTDSILCDIIDYDELYAPPPFSLVLPPSPHRPPFPLAC